jgi:hypothetical protein
MKARIRKRKLIIALPLEDPKPSASGKSMVVASSHGVRRTRLKLNGKSICIVANAWVRIDEEQKQGRKMTVAARNRK